MPRLFTGVEIPTDVAFDLDLMRGGVVGARWIDRENYHITLRFIGDIDDGLAREIAYELEGVEARPFTLRLKAIDAFGGNKPHSFMSASRKARNCAACRRSMSASVRCSGLTPSRANSRRM